MLVWLVGVDSHGRSGQYRWKLTGIPLPWSLGVDSHGQSGIPVEIDWHPAAMVVLRDTSRNQPVYPCQVQLDCTHTTAAHMGQGAPKDILGVETRDPAMGQGVHIQEKSSPGPISKYTHSGHNTQRSFDPPPTPLPHNRGTQVQGGTGVKIQKIIGGSLLVLKG